MILLTGASGNAGKSIIKSLLARGRSVRVLTSSATSAERLKGQGVTETVVGDLRSDADVGRAAKGTDTVIHLAPSLAEDETEMGVRTLEQSKAAGVGHFVYISCFHSQISEMPHHVSKRRVEEAVIKGGVPYTILQPSMFMQNLGHIWGRVRDEGVFAWPWPAEGNRYAMIDCDDIGETTAIVATDTSYQGGAYELCSADVLTVSEMAAMLGEAWGRPIKAGMVPPDAFVGAQRAAGASDWFINTVLDMCRFHAANGYDGGNPRVLASILGRRPGDYRAFVRRWLTEQGVLENQPA